MVALDPECDLVGLGGDNIVGGHFSSLRNLTMPKLERIVKYSSDNHSYPLAIKLHLTKTGKTRHTQIMGYNKKGELVPIADYTGKGLRVPVRTENGEYYAIINDGWNVEFGITGYDIPGILGDVCSFIPIYENVGGLIIENPANKYNSAYELIIAKLRELVQGGHMQDLLFVKCAKELYERKGLWDEEAVQRGLNGYLRQPTNTLGEAINLVKEYPCTIKIQEGKEVMELTKEEYLNELVLSCFQDDYTKKDTMESIFNNLEDDFVSKSLNSSTASLLEKFSEEFSVTRESFIYPF